MRGQGEPATQLLTPFDPLLLTRDCVCLRLGQEHPRSSDLTT